MNSPYSPPTLAGAWKTVIAGTQSPRLLIGDFVDDWRRYPDPVIREGLVRDPLTDVADDTLHRWGAFCAAMVEYLTVRDGVPTPTWVFADHWVLPTPWFLLPHWKMRAWLLVATPPPWKRRRIFGGDETMMIGRV
ncbi:MAG: hypothetical protein M0Z53_05575 [Thermaerobacter sp.]|nr:hypothetical protein [Thermaerobacter sp.]